MTMHERSSIGSVNKSMDDERTYNMNFLKMIYTLYFFQLLVAFIFTSFAMLYEDSFEWLKSIWIICTICLGICLGLIIACMLTTAARNPPLNFIIFLLFTVLFAFGIACFSLIDSSGVLYFTLTTQTLIALGFMLYTIFTSTYMQTVPSLLFVIGFSLTSLLSFIVLSDVSLFVMLICYFLCVVYGFYINYDANMTHRGSAFNNYKEDPFSGSVRIWGEGALVFCRLVELIAGMFEKTTH